MSREMTVTIDRVNNGFVIKEVDNAMNPPETMNCWVANNGEELIIKVKMLYGYR